MHASSGNWQVGRKPSKQVKRIHAAFEARLSLCFLWPAALQRHFHADASALGPPSDAFFVFWELPSSFSC
jgi:hypothetical protein